MDQERCLEILKGYGVGPLMLLLIEKFWDLAILACHASGYYDKLFNAHCGVTQGAPFLPCIFNVMVDTIVREWLHEMLGPDAVRTGMGKRFAPCCLFSTQMMHCWHPGIQS